MLFSYPNGVHAVACAGSVVLTQTHPAAPYVCRTGSITLRCQYGCMENVLVVHIGLQARELILFGAVHLIYIFFTSSQLLK